MDDDRSETLTLRRERSQHDDHAATEAGSEAKDPNPLIDRGTSLGRYVILDTLGEGGMGVVYAAYDPELDRRIAIKLLRHSTSTEGNARLLREARAMARLNHRNVATVHDVGTVDGSVFIAMEHLEGETLKEHLSAEPKRRDFKEVLRLFLAAAEGLAAAHGAGFIHRDFKPENVMLTTDGRVVVLDFGLAAPPAEGTSSNDLSEAPFDGSSLTATGTIMGTPAYMSPEQMSGKAVGPASDQFSFCVSLFEGLYGERPYRGDNYVELFDNLSSGDRRARPDNHDVPGWVLRAIDRGLEVSPDDRFASMGELIAALRDDPSVRRNRLLVPAFAATTIGILAAVGWFAAPDADDPCADATAAMSDVYGDDQRDAIRAMGPDAGPRLVMRLDRYAEHWAETRSKSCQANRVRHEETDELYDRRLVCLEERLYALESFVARLTKDDQGDVSSALLQSSHLPAVELCEIDAFVLADVPPPNDPEVAQEVRDIRRRLELETRRAHLGGTIAAKNDSIPLLERARATGYGPVVAEVLVDEARTAYLKGDPSAGETAQEALLTAERHRHDRTVFECLQVLARIETQQQRRDRAEEHLQLAAAVLHRLGNPEALQLSLLRSTAELALRGHDPGRVRQALEQALELRRANGTYDTLWSVADSAILAEACLGQRDYACGRTSAEHALEVARKELGPMHPVLGELNVIAGNVALGDGNADAALERYAEAAERFVASDEGAYNVAALSNQAAQAYVVAGRLDEAEREFKAGIELGTRDLDASEPNFVGMRCNYVEFLLEHGRVAEACPELEEIQQLARSTIERQWSIGRTSAALWGDCLRIDGDPKEAKAAYERALVLSEGDTADQGYVLGFDGLARLALEDGDLDAAEANARRGAAIDLGNDLFGTGARIRFTLAEILAAAGRTDDAVQSAREAEERYAATGCCPEALARARSWLAARGAD